MSCPLRTWAIRGLHKFFSFVYFLESFPHPVQSSIYSSLLCYSLFPSILLTFSMSCERQILRAFFPFYVSQKFNLSLFLSDLCVAALLKTSALFTCSVYSILRIELHFCCFGSLYLWENCPALNDIQKDWYYVVIHLFLSPFFFF